MERVTFSSEGAELAGSLLLPEREDNHPLVVMTHGFSATTSMTADKYAEVLRDHGLAVLLYDHRGFGASGGEPRQQINPWVQARGYRDAISYASQVEHIDSERIAIWGDSYSGAAALAVAAVDDRVAALAVQVPAIGSEMYPKDEDGSLYEAIKEMILSGDVEPSSQDEVDGPMPVVSDDQVLRPSALKPLTAYRWFTEYGNRPGTGWINQVTRVRKDAVAVWRPGLCARHVTCPSIFLVSPTDEMPSSVPTVSRAAFDQINGPKEWVDIEGGHFGLLYYPSKEFERASSAQARFLTSHLGG